MNTSMSEAIVRAINPNFLSMDCDLSEHKAEETLSVGGDYPNSTLAESLFMSFGLMHIVAPFLPDEIRTDFPVLSMAQVLTDELYRHTGHNPPDWYVPWFDTNQVEGGMSRGEEVAITYSGGKDSMWNMMNARNHGYNPLAVHIHGLNKSVAKAEHDDVIRQQGVMLFPLAVVDLGNSSSQKGYVSMRSRDILLTALSIPLALDYGANKILTEGNFIEGEEAPLNAFCYAASTWETYNALLYQAGVDIQMIGGTNHGEIQSITELMQQQPEWLSSVSNCMSMPGFRKSIAAGLHESAPNFPLFESQCGRCVKCRTISLVRIKNRELDPNMDSTPTEDIVFFLNDTERWLKKKYEEIKDYMDDGLVDLLGELKQQYIG